MISSSLVAVSNFQSKRKTPTVISFYRNERQFGADALALLSRKPDVTIAKLSRMVGRAPDHPLVRQLNDEFYFPYEITSDNSTGHSALLVGSELYAPEELMAMLLQHAKDMAAAHTGGKVIKDCVLTVPSGFTISERRALIAAASIADLKVLSLVEENTAAALHFGVDRAPEDAPSTVLLYNMGAGGVQVSIVKYSSFTAKDAGKDKAFSQFEVLGKAWDFSCGSFAMDLKLADLLARRFNDQWKKKPADEDVRKHLKPMIRLRQEAVKIREVLSANAEIPVRIEQLHANNDLHTKISRAEFELELLPLLSAAAAPIQRALDMANMSLSDIDSVEMLGGGVRVPAVKKMLDDYFAPVPRIDVGQHMNGDEAMALGASFRGANISTAFRVRKVGMTDISSFGVSVTLENLPSSPQAEGLMGSVMSSIFGKSETEKSIEPETEKWIKQVSLYASGSAVPSKTKTVAFQHDKDLLCRLEYDDPSQLPAGTDKIVTVYNISGVAAYAKESKDVPKVQLSFVLDSSGLVTLVKAEAVLERPQQVNTTTTSGDETNSTADTNSTLNNTTKKEKKQKKDKKSKKVNDPYRRVLQISEITSAVSPPIWSDVEIAASKLRLKELDAADEKRRAREAALNSLEAYIYSTRNALEDVNADDAIAMVTTSEQRNDVVEMCNAAEEWLYDEGRAANELAFRDREASIALKVNAMQRRAKEFTDRPKTIQRALTKLSGVTSHVEDWATKHPHITDSEKEQLLNMVAKAEKWIQEKTEAQSLLSDTDEPAFTCDEVKAKIKAVTNLYDKLSKKPKPTPETAESKTSQSESAEEMKSEEMPEKEAQDKKDDPQQEEEDGEVESADDTIEVIADDEL